MMTNEVPIDWSMHLKETLENKALRFATEVSDGCTQYDYIYQLKVAATKLAYK